MVGCPVSDSTHTLGTVECGWSNRHHIEVLAERRRDPECSHVRLQIQARQYRGGLLLAADHAARFAAALDLCAASRHPLEHKIGVVRVTSIALPPAPGGSGVEIAPLDDNGQPMLVTNFTCDAARELAAKVRVAIGALQR